MDSNKISPLRKRLMDEWLQYMRFSSSNISVKFGKDFFFWNFNNVQQYIYISVCVHIFTVLVLQGVTECRAHHITVGHISSVFLQLRYYVCYNWYPFYLVLTLANSHNMSDLYTRHTFPLWYQMWTFTNS